MSGDGPIWQWFPALYPCTPLVPTWSITPVVCSHCWCVPVPPEGIRTEPHEKCCKCLDVRVIAK